jgi:hypothetical protein
MLMRIRTLQKPWAQMTEAEQTECAGGIELAARHYDPQHCAPCGTSMSAVVQSSPLAELKIGGTNGTIIKTCPNIGEYRNVFWRTRQDAGHGGLCRQRNLHASPVEIDK